MTRPSRWINTSGSTTDGGKLLRGGQTAPATAAIDGQSPGFGFMGSKPSGNCDRPESISKCPPEWSGMRMGQRADQRPLVAALGQHRQVFANLNARRARGDRV